jgi:hypothetical protein
MTESTRPTFPRRHRMSVDNGEPRRHVEKKKCFNCSSSRFKETISIEDCPDCGLHCDYWGGGANQIYRDAMAWKERERIRLEEEKREREEREEAAALFYRYVDDFGELNFRGWR